MSFFVDDSEVVFEECFEVEPVCENVLSFLILLIVVVLEVVPPNRFKPDFGVSLDQWCSV